MPSHPDTSTTGPAGGSGPDARATPAALFWWLVAAAVALDQVTKVAAILAIKGRGLVTVIPRFFYLTYAENPGMVFGLGRGLGAAGPFVLAAVNAVIIGIIIHIWRKVEVRRLRRLLDLAMGLVLAGAFGNIIDRLHPPFKVVDFLDFWLGTPGEKTWHYPTFNVADIYIVAGVAMYIYWAWRIDVKKIAPE